MKKNGLGGCSDDDFADGSGEVNDPGVLVPEFFHVVFYFFFHDWDVVFE